ncbi:MAG: beta-glucosidase [Frankiaceae bacterium]|nr:beta-glucosidase [Frankiaceae bacterium]
MSGPFPPGFLWGTATSAHQIEGNNTNSDWWAFEHSAHPLIREPSGDAADSYHRWGEDMDLLAAAGFTDYRFSIEWARIEPAPGEFSAAHIDYYRRMVAGALARGLRPLVTLHHFTHPLWFAERGGWVGDAAVDLFVRYVEAAAPILAEGVQHVCTINEPNIVSLFAAIREQRLPSVDLRDITPDPGTTDALIEAHHAATVALKARNSTLDVGWSIACLNVVADAGADDAATDYARTRQTIFTEAAQGDDWVGVQAYTRTRIGLVDGRPVVVKPGSDVERTLTGWEYYPRAVGDAIREVRRTAVDVPIIVTENGIATADDLRRIDYTKGALASVHDAMQDGADVRGYFHWSLLDNYEWGSYGPTFGLVSVDRLTFARFPKPSLAWLGALAPAAHHDPKEDSSDGP